MWIKVFCHYKFQKQFENYLSNFKNTFKVALQYLLNVFTLLNTNSYFKLKIDPKTCTFKNTEKIFQKHLATL